MELIKGAFQCRWCMSEIVDPVVLPCGESVCEKHTEELRETKWKCLLCHDIHTLTSGQHFLENKSLRRILKLEMAKLDFGLTYKEAKQQVNKLDDKNNELKRAISEPSDYVSRFTQKYINQVDVAREEMIKIVDDACDKMKQEINSFKSSCEARIRKGSSTLIDLQKSVETKINKWREKLDELVVNEPLWQEITNQAKSIQEDIKSKISEKAFEPPLALRHVTDMIKKYAWSQLSRSRQIPEIKISDTRDKNSVLVRGVSKIAKAESWKQINSEEFAIQGFPFYLGVQFSVLDGKMWLGAYLFSRSRHEKQTVEVSRKFSVYGKHYQIIKHTTNLKYEYDKAEGWGFSKLISLNDIMADSAYDPEEDIVRVEVEIDEKSVQVKDKAPSTRK